VILLSSVLVTSILAVIVGIYLHIQPWSDVGVPIAISLWFVSSGIGYLTIWTFVVDFSPSNLKLIGIFMAIACIASKVAIWIFPSIVKWMGVENIFFLFAATSIIKGVCAFSFLPEAKDWIRQHTTNNWT
jgi:hypothetical protein